MGKDNQGRGFQRGGGNGGGKGGRYFGKGNKSQANQGNKSEATSQSKGANKKYLFAPREPGVKLEHTYQEVWDQMKMNLSQAFDSGPLIVETIEKDELPNFEAMAPEAELVTPKTKMTREKIIELENEGIVYEGKQYLTPKEIKLQKFYDTKFSNAMKIWSAKVENFEVDSKKAYDWIFSKLGCALLFLLITAKSRVTSNRVITMSNYSSLLAITALLQ